MIVDKLYTTATAIGLLAFVTTSVDGILNCKRANPNLQLTLFIIGSALATYLRVPLLLTDKGTTRERVMFLGYIVLEGVAAVFNLLAFRKHRMVISVSAALVFVCIVLLLSTKILQRLLARRQSTN